MEHHEEDQKVAREVAEAEFDRWAEAMDLDLDTSEMDAEDLAAFGKQKRRIVRAIERGAVVINDTGEAVFTPERSSGVDGSITFHEHTGASLMAVDGKKKNEDVRKTFAVMADMTKQHPSVFSKLRGSDTKVAMALFALLMD